MRHLRRAPRGFTLIEILIVVIILGILAAIVIPQFSNASTSAKISSVSTTAQTLRSQIALYRLQHNDQLPPDKCWTNVAFVNSDFWLALTSVTDPNGNQVAVGTAGAYGPYMQSIPANALNLASTVTDLPGCDTNSTAGAFTGWVYDYNVGQGTGRLYGTDQSGTKVIP